MSVDYQGMDHEHEKTHHFKSGRSGNGCVCVSLRHELGRTAADNRCCRTAKRQPQAPVPDAGIGSTGLSRKAVQPHGLRRGAGRKDKNTVAFAKAIAACNQAGGGRILVPAGTWFTGPIIFKSNVELHLEKGAVVSFSSDPVDYAPSVFASLGRARPGLICNNGGQNIALTGEGEFLGNGQPWWKPVAEKKKLKLKRDPRVSTIPAEFSFTDPGTGRKATIGRPTFVSFNNSTTSLSKG